MSEGNLSNVVAVLQKQLDKANETIKKKDEFIALAGKFGDSLLMKNNEYSSVNSKLAAEVTALKKNLLQQSQTITEILEEKKTFEIQAAHYKDLSEEYKLSAIDAISASSESIISSANSIPNPLNLSLSVSSISPKQYPVLKSPLVINTRKSPLPESSITMASPLPRKNSATLTFMKLSLEDARIPSSPFVSTSHKSPQAISSDEPTDALSLSDEMNIVLEYLKNDLGSLYVPDKFTQNFNFYQIRQNRKQKEYKISVDTLQNKLALMKTEIDKIRKENSEYLKEIKSLEQVRAENRTLRNTIVELESAIASQHITMDQTEVENRTFRELITSELGMATPTSTFLFDINETKIMRSRLNSLPGLTRDASLGANSQISSNSDKRDNSVDSSAFTLMSISNDSN